MVSVSVIQQPEERLFVAIWSPVFKTSTTPSACPISVKYIQNSLILVFRLNWIATCVCKKWYIRDDNSIKKAIVVQNGVLPLQ
jgi:hypothetical protein